MELYYYTSTDTMRYILEKGDIFATNIRYMNDSEEYTNGLEELYRLAGNTDLVKKWKKDRKRTDVKLKDIRQTFTDKNLKKCMKIMDFYSISFCQKNDLLSQWAIYAKESGVSIKMNFEKDSYHFYTDSVFYEDGEREPEKSEWNLVPEQVCYFTYDSMEKEKVEYEEKAFQILDKLYAKDSKDQTESKDEVWRYVSTFVKRYDFYQEAESRLVFQPKRVAFFPKVHYRQDHKVLKPYLDIICEDGWPIWEIMIGPGFNQKVVYNSVEHFLDHVEVKAGIRDVDDYLERIKAYLRPHVTELEKYDGYRELQRFLESKDRISKMPLEDARIVLGEQLQQICNDVRESKKFSPELKKYMERRHFLNTGIVLSKSSIPYIY